MKEIFYVAAGGGIGAVFRYLLTKYTTSLFNWSIPLGTLIENTLGGFLISIVFGISISTNKISPGLKLFLTTGMLGGFTTFSTFSYETVKLISEGKYLLGICNVLLNVILSLSGAAIGMLIFKS